MQGFLEVPHLYCQLAIGDHDLDFVGSNFAEKDPHGRKRLLGELKNK